MNWEDGFVINIKVQDGDVVVSANREGLLSLASHFKMLAQGAVGDHFHLDQYNSLWVLTDSNRRPSACKADALNQLS